MFPRLGERIDLPADSLSGGSSRCVPWGWARSLAPLFMVDELSLGLAPILVDAIYEAVSRVRERGMTVLIVEQDVLIALEQANRGYVLDVGHITMAVAQLGCEPYCDKRLGVDRERNLIAENRRLMTQWRRRGCRRDEADGDYKSC